MSEIVSQTASFEKKLKLNQDSMAKAIRKKITSRITYILICCKTRAQIFGKYRGKN